MTLNTSLYVNLKHAKLLLKAVYIIFTKKILKLKTISVNYDFILIF